jgi:hypothetical protein
MRHQNYYLGSASVIAGFLFSNFFVAEFVCSSGKEPDDYQNLVGFPEWTEREP